MSTYYYNPHTSRPPEPYKSRQYHPNHSYSDYPRHPSHDIVSDSSPYTPLPQQYHKPTPRHYASYDYPSHSDPYEPMRNSSRMYASYDPSPYNTYRFSGSYYRHQSSFVAPASCHPLAHHSDNYSYDTHSSYPQSPNSYDSFTPDVIDYEREDFGFELKRERLARMESIRKKVQEEVTESIAIWAKFPKAWSEHVAKEKLEQQKKSAVVLIQSHSRGFLERRSLERKRQAILFIQARVRGSLQKTLFLRIQRSATIIQMYVRQWILRRSVICQSQWIYYNPLFSVDGEDWEEESVVEEPLSTVQTRVATPMDLLQRFGRPLLSSPGRDPPYMLDDAAEGLITCSVVSSDSGESDGDVWQMGQFSWDPGDIDVMSDSSFTPRPDMVLLRSHIESAAPSLYFTVVDQILSRRPPSKPPKARDSYCSLLRSASETDTGLMICGSTVRIRPPLKPPWRL